MTRDAGNIDRTGSPWEAAHGLDEDGKFQYKPLDLNSKCIRLLEVLSESNTGRIKCNLREVSLDNDPGYIALSYTWDRNMQAKEIEVNGRLLTIGQNLWRFLHRYLLASESTRSFLWIDALCIDQANVRERNHQVKQMREIYAGANSVIVWLGDEVDYTTTQLAYDLMIEPNRLPSGTENDTTRRRSEKRWEALRTLFDEPHYWSRVWIIQEFILAKSVEIWCGDRSAPLKNFEKLCRYAQQSRKRLYPRPAETMGVLWSRGWTLSQHRSKWQHGGKAGIKASTFGLQRLLRTYAGSQSTDIRDRVYALLGIACDTSQAQHPIVVDYAKSNIEVLVDVVQNQCQWNSPSMITKSYEFIGSLCKWLGVSSAALIFYVIRHVPGAQSHIDILNTGTHVHVPLRFIGGVIDVGCFYNSDGETFYNPDEETPDRLTLNWNVERIQDFSRSAQSKSVSVQWNHSLDDTGAGTLLNILNIDVSALYADERDPPQSSADALKLSTNSTSREPNCNAKFVAFHDNLFSYEVQDIPRNRITSGSKDHRPSMTGKAKPMGKLNVVMCANNLRNLLAIESTTAYFGDVINVLLDNSSLALTIITRRSALT